MHTSLLLILTKYHAEEIEMQTNSNQIYLVTFMLTQASFFTKNQMLQIFFLISVMLRWHSGVKNHEIWTFKVNFLCQKMSKSFQKNFH